MKHGSNFHLSFRPRALAFSSRAKPRRLTRAISNVELVSFECNSVTRSHEIWKHRASQVVRRPRGFEGNRWPLIDRDSPSEPYYCRRSYRAMFHRLFVQDIAAGVKNSDGRRKVGCEKKLDNVLPTAIIWRLPLRRSRQIALARQTPLGRGGTTLRLSCRTMGCAERLPESFKAATWEAQIRSDNSRTIYSATRSLLRDRKLMHVRYNSPEPVQFLYADLK